jgi:glycosyltransferase involved in cell wall biosynthesis
MSIRLAIIVSHPIQHFAPWHRELAQLPDVDLKVFFCCDWGVNSYLDPQFKTEVKWDIPLLEGYANEFLPIARRPQRLGFWAVDNPSVGVALDHFQPDVVKIFGYAHRTNWRAARWARQNRRPVLFYSDSNVHIVPAVWKRAIKTCFVGWFYNTYVDGALFVGDNNRDYHIRYGLSSPRLFYGALPIECQRLLAAVRDRDAVRRRTRDQLNIPLEAFVILFCGKLTEGKRAVDLALAARDLKKKGVPVWALLVGEGEKRVSLEALCKTENIHNVRLAGFVNQSAVAHYYAASEAIAVTSELDAHPLVVSEAGCLGLPVVISDRVGCIGPNDSARPSGNAIVYPCGDVQALAEAIERLWRDRDLYRRMVVKSSEIALSQDVTAAAQQLAAAVRQLRQLGRRSHSKNRFQPASEVAAS